jgi:hypothetical protein
LWLVGRLGGGNHGRPIVLAASKPYHVAEREENRKQNDGEKEKAQELTVA